MAIDLEETGFIDVTLAGHGPVHLDLWRTHNELYEITQRTAGQAQQQHQAVVDYLVKLGFPEVSHHLADRFAGAIFEASEAVKKKEAGG